MIFSHLWPDGFEQNKRHIAIDPTNDIDGAAKKSLSVEQKHPYVVICRCGKSCYSDRNTAYTNPIVHAISCLGEENLTNALNKASKVSSASV